MQQVDSLCITSRERMFGVWGGRGEISREITISVSWRHAGAS